MPITGEMLIGAAAVRGQEATFRAVNPASGEEIDPAFGGAGRVDVDQACALAWAAFDPYRETAPRSVPVSWRRPRAGSWTSATS